MGDKIIAVTPDKCFMNIGTEMVMEKHSRAIYFMRSEPSPNYPSVNKVCIFQTHWVKKQLRFQPQYQEKKQKCAVPVYKSRRHCYEAWWNINKNAVRCGGELAALGTWGLLGPESIHRNSSVCIIPHCWVKCLPDRSSLAGKGGRGVLTVFTSL